MAEDNQKPLSERDLELQEYKLTDRVQERLLARGKFIFGVFLAGLTLLGIVGSSFLVEHISEKVAQDIRKDLAKETDALNKRLRDTLAELNVSASEIQKVAEKSKGRLELLAGDYKKLEDLNTRYTKLHAEVEMIGKNLATTTRAVKAARVDTDSLRTALVLSTEGKPALIWIRFHWSVDKSQDFLGAIFSGANLGSRPGNGRLILMHEVDSGRRVISDPIEIDAASVKEWKPEKIELLFSNSMQAKVNAAWTDLSKKLQLKTGEVSSRIPVFQFKLNSGEIISTSDWPTNVR